MPSSQGLIQTLDHHSIEASYSGEHQNLGPMFDDHNPESALAYAAAAANTSPRSAPPSLPPQKAFTPSLPPQKAFTPFDFEVLAAEVAEVYGDLSGESG